jgi:TP901 family phage tail tape measure protein
MAEVVNRRVNIYIDQQAAIAALQQLEKKQALYNQRIEECRSKQRDLQLQMQQAAAAGRDISKLQLQYDRVTASLKNATAELSKSEKASQKLKEQIDSGLGSTLAQQEKLVTRLRNELRNMSENAPGYAEKFAAYRTASDTFLEMKKRVDGVADSMSDLKQQSLAATIGVAAGEMITGLIESAKSMVSGIVDNSAIISDELSDIQKTTGLTEDQVRTVNNELKKLDTRTSFSQLRQLASEAGKLGNESVEDVKRFVAEANIIDVALGEDLGADAITQISKLSKIFHTGMLNIASAINSIGAASEASESFQVDFLSRVAGVAQTAKLSAPDLLAYGAALEINGQTAEVSGTALSKFFLDFVGNTEKFGRAAGYAKGELKALIDDKGTNAAFMDFLVRLKQVSPTSDLMIQKLQELNIEGSSGANVFLTLANNLGLVKSQQDVANQSYSEGISVIQEYNTKNNNAAAELEKLKKSIESVFTADSLLDAVGAGVRAVNSFIASLRNLPQFIMENKVAVLTLVAGLILLNGNLIQTAIATLRAQAAQVAYNVGFAIGNGLLSASISLQAAYITVTNLLMGRITAATAVQRLWNIAVASNPLGAILVLIGAVAAAISVLTSNTEKQNASARVNMDINKAVAENTAEQISKIQYLTKIVNDNTLSEETRKKALQELININPEYLKGLNAENAATTEGKRIIDDYIKSLQQKAREEAAVSFRSKKLEEDMQLGLLQQDVEGKIANGKTSRSDLSSEEREYTGNNAFTRNSGTIMNVLTWSNTADRALEGIKDARAKIKDELDEIDNILKKEFSTTPADKTTEASNTSSLIVKRTIADIKAEIAGLEKVYDQIDIKDKSAFKANLDRRKALKKELDNLNGKESPENKNAESLASELKRIARELTAYNESQYEKDIIAVENKYSKLEQKARNNSKLLAEVERLKFLELSAVNQKYFEDVNKALQKAAADERNLYLKKNEEQKQQVLESAKNAAKLLTGNLESSIARLNRDQLAKAELDARKAGFLEQLKAQKEFLEEQKRQELSNVNLTAEERQLIEQKYRESNLRLELEYAQKVLSAVSTLANSVLSIYDGITSNKTRQEDNYISRLQSANEKEKASYQRLLNAKLITQAQYDAKVNKLDKQLEEKEKKAKLDQFEREKTSNIVRANIQIAQAILQALSSSPPPYNFILAGIVAAAGAVQLLNIKNQEAPEFGTGGFLDKGPKHRSRYNGLPVVNPYTGKPVAYLEQGEGIVNARTMASKRKYTLSGTASEITSTLNGAGGGVTWDRSAEMLPFWKTTPVKPINLRSAKRGMDRIRIMEFGGIFNAPVVANKTPADNTGDIALYMDLVLGIVERNSAVMDSLANQLSQGIMAKTYLTEAEAQQARIDNIRREATFKR